METDLPLELASCCCHILKGREEEKLAHVSSVTAVIAGVIGPKCTLTYVGISLGYLKQRS